MAGDMEIVSILRAVLNNKADFLCNKNIFLTNPIAEGVRSPDNFSVFKFIFLSRETF